MSGFVCPEHGELAALDHCPTCDQDVIASLVAGAPRAPFERLPRRSETGGPARSPVEPPSSVWPRFSWPAGGELVGELGGLKVGGRYRAADDGRWATVRYLLKGAEGRCVALVDFDDGQGGFWEFKTE